MEGATVELDRTDIKTTTAADGTFTLPGIPTGTYDVVLSKEGYASRTLWETKVYAVDDSLDLGTLSIYMPSSIEIENFRIEKEGDKYLAKGTIYHKFPLVSDGDIKIGPAILVFYSENSDVSLKDTYYFWQYYFIPQPSGTEFSIPEISRILSGSKRYYVAYGMSISSSMMYEYHFDSTTGKYQSFSELLGKPSNITSFSTE